MATKCIISTGAITPQPRDYSVIFLGPQWPSNECFEVADFRGEGLPEQLARFILDKLPAARTIEADIPRLETGLEPFDPAKARVIADGGHQARWHDLFRRAIERATPEEIDRLASRTEEIREASTSGKGFGSPRAEWGEIAAKPINGDEPRQRNGSVGAPGSQPEWQGKLATAIKNDLSNFRLVISATKSTQALIELDRIHSVIAKAKSNGGSVDQKSLLDANRDVCTSMTNAIETRAKAISDGMRRYATSFGMVHLAHRYSGGQLKRATFVNVPDIEALIQMPPPPLVQQIASRSRVVDLVFTAPISDPRVLDALAEEWFGLAPQLHGMIWACPAYSDVDDLLTLANNVPPGGSVGQGHICQIAGMTYVEGVGGAVPSLGAVVGRRGLLDQTLDPKSDRWGVATPMFGPQTQNLLPGLHATDCLRWTDSQREQLAELGVNSLNALGSDIHLFRNRTRSTLPEMLQADSVRFRDYLAGAIRAYLDRAAPGQLSTPLRRRMLADGAKSIWKDFIKLDGFNARLDAGPSTDPKTFIGHVQLPNYGSIEESILYFETVNPGQ
jgi:hypothetical protein